MQFTIVNRARLACFAVLCAVWISACAANPNKMVPDIGIATSGFDAGVDVQVSGAKENLAKNASIQTAVELAIAKSQLFPSASPSGYTLRLDVLAIENPALGLDLTSKVRIAWLLRKKGNPDSIWQEQISSEAKAGLGENLIAAQRMAMANERAIAANIELGLVALSKFAEKNNSSDKLIN